MVDELWLSIILVLWCHHSHGSQGSRRSRRSRSAELCQSLTVNALHTAQCIAAISSLHSRERFSSSMCFYCRVSSPSVHFARADIGAGKSASFIDRSSAVGMLRSRIFGWKRNSVIVCCWSTVSSPYIFDGAVRSWLSWRESSHSEVSSSWSLSSSERGPRRCRWFCLRDWASSSLLQR